MFLIGVILVIVALGIARRMNWPLIRKLDETWERSRPQVFAYIRNSPATFAYLIVLSITTWVLLGSSDRVARLLLLQDSTSLHQFRIDPLKVLIRSAFWAPGYEFLAAALLFAIILAPAEQWLGTRRLVTVFASGHVLATLGAATTLWLSIRYGWSSKRLENTVDVGVSYGFAAVAAIFTFRLPTKWCWWSAMTLVAVAVAALFISQTSTDVGHLLALAIGFAFYPMTRTEQTRSRARGRVWSTQPIHRQAE
jgi:uncharacterized membrane protein